MSDKNELWIIKKIKHFYWAFGGEKMIYGYVRGSTQIQKIERKITNILREYLDEVIKKESLLN